MSRIGQILGFRDYGKFKPRHFDIAQEKRQLSGEETRQALRRLAMTQATLTKRRDLIARKMYHNEAISLDDFPGLEPLTPKERTRLLADLREVYGLRKDGKKP